MSIQGGGLNNFVSGGTRASWSEESQAARYESLVAADYSRTKAGLGSHTAEPEESAAASTVATHYNSIPDRHRTLESGSEILRLRNLNNFIKSLLIAKHLPRNFGTMGHAVLDLACGKGGDMLKFKQGKCAMYVGIDIAAQSVRDAIERYNGTNGRPGMPFAATFMVGDFGAVTLESYIPAGLRFALASCQFALHYAFASEARARVLLANAASRLAAGGTFVATIPDANVLVRRLRAAPALKFGNALYSVQFAEAHLSKHFDPATGPFGLAYRFSLKEAVEDCEEYLVHMPTLRQLADDAGLELLYAKNFTEFFAEECGKNSELLERMKVLPPESGGRLSEEEWEVAHTYQCVAFKKKALPGCSEPSKPVKNPGNKRLSESDIVFLGTARRSADVEEENQRFDQAADKRARTLA